MSYKKFDLSNDVTSLVSYVNEVIAVSGSIFDNAAHIKKYDNITSGSATKLGGYWQTCYDASHTSSLSTAIFDVAYGYSTGSVFNQSVTSRSSQNEKIKNYRMFADVLLGNKDLLFTINNQEKTEAFFVVFKRNIHKDEIKKGTVSLTVNTDLASSGISQYSASDEGAVTAFKQGVGGEYAPLRMSGSGGTEVGQVWYNAGVVILSPDAVWSSVSAWSGTDSLSNAQFSSSIDQLCDGLREHLERIDLHNQTNLHSTVYFCRALNTEFNYSSNPTFTDDNQRIRVTSGSNILQTRTYITTIGLYDASDNLVAAAKVNKPVMKSPDTEAVFRIRLDY